MAAPSADDPQAVALAQLVGIDESSVRTSLSLLLAGIVELASSLGFAIIALATRAVPVPPGIQGTVMPAQDPIHPLAKSVWRPRLRTNPSARTRTPAEWPIEGRKGKLANLQDQVRGFLQARTIHTQGAILGSTELHEAFRSYCGSQGFAERSQQALGRELTRLGLAKGRCSRTGRIAYIGITLNDQDQPITDAARTDPVAPSDPKIQRRTAPPVNGSAADPKVRKNGFASSRDHAMGTA